MANEYTIGQAAELLNLTRDALRFYEKKKLVTPKKKENGYRYYEEEDICLLLDLICWRKAQCSIEEIRTMYDEGGPACMEGFIEQKIEEEKQKIREHQKLLLKLEVFRHIIKKITESRDRYSVCAMPRYYVVSEKAENFSRVREMWFAASRLNNGLEHCVLHEEYFRDQNGQEQYACYLALEEWSVRKLKLEEYLRDAPVISFPCCVHTVFEADCEQVDALAVEQMKSWAQEQGIPLTGEVHSHYLWNNQKEGRFIKSYLELYMPVCEQVQS